MSAFFKMVEPEPPPGADDGLPTFAEGGRWRIIKDGEAYVLSYVSGELAGREKAIVIDKADAERLARGAADIDAILIHYGVN